MGVVIKPENDWREVRPAASSCNASRLRPVLVYFSSRELRLVAVVRI